MASTEQPRVTYRTTPRRPENDREAAYHDALWAARSDNARIRRLAATAHAKLRGGDVDGAMLELDMI